MLWIPHWILFVSIFCLWIWLKHLFELSSTIVCLFDTETQQKLDLYDDVILLNISMEGMLLQDLIICSLSRLTKLASAVHPSPEILRRSYDVVWNVIQNIIELVITGIRSEVRMLIVGLDLKQRITFS